MENIKSVFNDARLDKRLEQIILQFQSKLGASVPQAAGSFHQAKAIYRFWDNKKVNPDKILLKYIEETLAKCKDEPVVLAIQDTTSIDFSTLKSCEGLGYLERSYQLGMKLHTSIAVSGMGLPIGILKEQYWERDISEYGKKKQRKSKATEAKESYRWIDFHNQINERLTNVTQLIHITDREGDIYEYLAAKRSASQYILLRIAQDRTISDEAHLIKSYLNDLPEMGRITVAVGRKGSQLPREAELQVRYGTVEVQRPASHLNKSIAESVTLQVIKASEADTDIEEPIEWYLATTLELNSIADVARCLRYYCYRWLIERLFYILKSGCNVEDLQLGTSERLECAISTYTITAMRILSMTYLSRIEPDIGAEAVFSEEEIMLLKQKYGKKEKLERLTLAQAVLMVGMLGGFMGRKGDGNPGLKTIWRGMSVLEYMVEGLRLARKTIEELSFQNNNIDDS